MATQSQWSIEFEGCTEADGECRSGHFRVGQPSGQEQRIEVRLTLQEETILAEHLGKQSLSPDERAAVLSVGGRDLIERHLREDQRPHAVLYLTSHYVFFEHPGVQRDLLRRAGLLQD